MTGADLDCLKSNVGKVVEVEAADGERLLAKVLAVFDAEDEPEEVFLDIIFTSRPDLYTRLAEGRTGFSFKLADILTVKARPDVQFARHP